MILYHGSNIEITQIDLSKSKPHKDFGKGFYLSDNEEQAFNMAKQRVIQTDSGYEVINRYEFDDSCLTNGSLNVKRFDSYSEEWAEFILANRDRNNKDRVHDYDIVIGPIADDKVGVQIRLFLEEYIDMATFKNRLQYLKGMTIQYYFGTQRAIQTLKKL